MSNVYIISAPSGAGKTSLVRGLCSSLPFVKPSISFTTRKIRESEVNGKDYFFITEDAFIKKIEDNDFIEYQNVYGNMYGSTIDSVSTITARGLDVILEIDYKGMMAVKRVIPEAISIYITPPSIEILKERLINRGEDDKDVIETRMASASKEMNYSTYSDYVVINDKFEDALNILRGILVFNYISNKNVADWAKKLTNVDNSIV